MKRAIQPTSIERKMRENDFIVSKTNPKGIITYGNPIFIEFSGYTKQVPYFPGDFLNGPIVSCVQQAFSVGLN